MNAVLMNIREITNLKMFGRSGSSFTTVLPKICLLMKPIRDKIQDGFEPSTYLEAKPRAQDVVEDGGLTVAKAEIKLCVKSQEPQHSDVENRMRTWCLCFNRWWNARHQLFLFHSFHIESFVLIVEVLNILIRFVRNTLLKTGLSNWDQFPLCRSWFVSSRLCLRSLREEFLTFSREFS